MRQALRAWRALLLRAPLVAMLGSGAVGAQPVPEDELAFWTAAVQSNDPREYLAYLAAYPNGRFAGLARLRAHPGVVPVPGPLPPIPPAPAANVLRVGAPVVLRVEGIVVELDASPFRNGSNLRLAVMPASAPDAIADVDAFVADSIPVSTARLRLTLPPGPPGQDEVRLYYVAQYASAFSVAARAPVRVGAGTAGAVLGRDLVREAERLGPVRFTAAHRDRPMLIETAFLRIRPQTEWDVRWFPGGLPERVGTRVVLLSLGVPGVEPDDRGASGELICVLPADSAAAIDRFAAMEVGMPVVVRAVPMTWSDGVPDPLVLDRCGLEG